MRPYKVGNAAQACGGKPDVLACKRTTRTPRLRACIQGWDLRREGPQSELEMKRKSLAIVIILFMFFAAGAVSPAGAVAQDAAPKVKVSGVVRSPGGDGVPAAAVRVIHVATGQAWATWTDEQGQFELANLPAGRYRIEAQQLGFDNGSVEANFADDKSPAAEIKLKVGGTTAAPAPKPATSAQQAAAQGNPPAAGQPGAATTPSPAANATATPGARQNQPGAQNRGFQQIDPTQLMNTAGGAMPTGGTDPAAAGLGDAGPLGEASSSDAFLMNGTVARGATAGGGFNPAALMGIFPFGIPGMMGGMDFGGGPMGGGGGNPFGGGPGAGGQQIEVTFMGGGGPAGGGGRAGAPGRQGQPQGQRGQQRGQGQGQRRDDQGGGPQTLVIGGPGGPGGPVMFGDGMGALMGAQRLMRAAANRTRFSFYNRYGHSALDARPYSLTAPDPVKIASYRESYGVSFGGPLKLGKLYDGRDKTFFFINYDGARRRNPVDSFSTVPLAAERGGDFTARGLQLFDPNSNLTGPRASLGSVIPAAMIDSAAAGLLQFIPLPNLPGTVQNFHLQARVPQSTDRFNIRLAHTINPKWSVSGSYSFSSTRSESIPGFPTLRGDQDGRQQAITLSLSQQASRQLAHNMALNWSRNRSDSLNLFAFLNDISGGLGITGISTAPINFGVPQINFTNFGDLNDPVPSLRRDQTLRVTDSVSYTRGKHTLRFGGELRRQQLNRVNDPTARGRYTFTGLMTSQLNAQGLPLPGTGWDFADFLLGLPQSTYVQFGSSRTYLRNWGMIGYVQDDWRWHPRFTVNAGLRYEAITPYTELFDKLANLDLNSSVTAVSVVLPGQTAPFSGSVPRSLIRGDYNNWQPRLGFAWRPKLKKQTSIRGGYSIFHNASIYTQLANQLLNQPPHSSAQTLLTSSAAVLTLRNGFPLLAPNQIPNTIAVDPNYRIGYAQMWNLSVETNPIRNVNIDVTYTGTKGTHLDLLRSPNRSLPVDPLSTQFSRRIPTASEFTYDTFGASSIYHALQLRVTRRMTRGLMLTGTYTYGKSLDNASSIGGGGQTVVYDDNNFALDRGRSSFDVRHRFNSFLFWDLPFGQRKRWAKSGWQEAVFSNFTVNANISLQSGTPYTARLLGNAANNSGTGASLSERPDQVGNPSLPRDQRDPLHFFNTAAFALPLPGAFGNAGRNTITGPGIFTVNGSVGRWIALGKDRQRRLDLRWEVQNLFNTPNFTGLNTVVNSTNYGRVSGARAMRSMDLNIRFNF